MTKQTPEETRKANESISRADDKSGSHRQGTSLAGRYGVAASAMASDDGEKSETERAAERASKSDDRS
ncbi:hypothetical protein EJC49_02915 [Aquibium carbonis]|uniref:Seed maturation protein n=2 Tax=Aquibium carbonis TaxID=2495581 RepID=A0A429Z2J2_9HYPH|nr:hypothetical protein EJC49_02915 [Aquibium carbonis]